MPYAACASGPFLLTVLETLYGVGMKAKHPMQPVVLTDDNVARFKENAIVRHLVDSYPGPHGGKLNALSLLKFSSEDWEQLLQLIGYSVDGFADHSCVDRKTVHAADEATVELLRKK